MGVVVVSIPCSYLVAVNHLQRHFAMLQALLHQDITLPEGPNSNSSLHVRLKVCKANCCHRTRAALK